ncbi:MAG: RHS repeat-associated core domain-containing protein [Phycisphaeraceae bacterium]|nr:RHS repeat-associated core domain-containing protein [Phycisphaeraceae bacterium]
MSRGLPAAVLEDAGSLFAADFAVTDYPKPDVRLDRVLDTVQARAKGGDTNRVGQYFWGLRYIDDLVFRREDRDLTNEPPPAEDPAEPDFDDAETPGWFALTDVQFSVVALMTPEGRIVERVVYDPCGRGRHHYAADYDGNGAVEVADLNGTYGHLTAWFADDMQADWDRDGTTYGDVPDIFAFQTDWFAQTGNAVAAGQISRRYAAGSGINANAPDNMIGYCGYVFNPETDDYTVRFRHYDPEIGRWLQRDPAGYVDGMNRTNYAKLAPTRWADPSGLFPGDQMYPTDLDGNPLPWNPNIIPAVEIDAWRTYELLIDWLEAGGCVAQCILLEMTDEDIEAAINLILDDADLPQQFRDLLIQHYSSKAFRSLSAYGKYIFYLRLLMGSGPQGRLLYKALETATSKEQVTKIVDGPVMKIVTRLAGKGASRLGGAAAGAVPGIGWALLGVDCYTYWRCVRACKDGSYNNVEVPFIEAFDDQIDLIDVILGPAWYFLWRRVLQ